jgi:hypothetical protein
MAVKNPGVTKRRLATRPSSRFSWRPSIETGQMPPRITIGRKLV